MERLELYITKNKKVKQGKGAIYNSITIELNRIQEREYKIQIIKQIEQIEQQIDNLKTFNYIPAKKRKITEKTNDAPVYNRYNSALVSAIKRNESARKEIEKLKELLK